MPDDHEAGCGCDWLPAADVRLVEVRPLTPDEAADCLRAAVEDGRLEVAVDGRPLELAPLPDCPCFAGQPADRRDEMLVLHGHRCGLGGPHGVMTVGDQKYHVLWAGTNDIHWPRGLSGPEVVTRTRYRIVRGRLTRV